MGRPTLLLITLASEAWACATVPATGEAKLSHTVKAASTDVERCAATALRREPGLEGQLLVAFILDKHGKVRDFEFSGALHGGQVPEGWVEGCIRKRSARWAFPPPPEAPYRVEVPIVIEAVKGGSAIYGPRFDTRRIDPPTTGQRR